MDWYLGALIDRGSRGGGEIKRRRCDIKQWHGR